MNLIFFGSGKFAVKSLEALFNAGHKINLVVTQPDRPKGRHLLPTQTDIKLKAQALKLNIYQPLSVNTEEALGIIKKTGADIFIVISYGHILGEELLQIPRLYALNAHASLLPKYRGAAPINWAIVKGENETGVSIIRMDEGLDSGDMILRKHAAIEGDDSFLTVEDKLSKLAALSLIEALELIKENKARFYKQDSSCISYAPKLKKSDGLIDWNKPAREIVNQIRGLCPWPGAYCYYKGGLLKIWQAKALGTKADSKGEILKVSKNGILVSSSGGCVEINELQLSGEKRLQAESFICGHKISAGEKLTCI